MKKLKTLTVLFAFLIQGSVFAMVFDTVIVKGIIKSFDSTHVMIEDGFGQIHKVEKKEFPKNHEFNQGKDISFLKKVNFQKISKFNIQVKNVAGLPEKYKTELLQALIQFHVSNEKFTNSTFPPKVVPEGKKTTTSYLEKFQQLMDYVFSPVFADGTLNCLYAGWPSVMGGNVCRSPWSTQARAASATYHTCGHDRAFRCNPELFGDGFTAEGLADGANATTPHAPYPGASVRVLNRAPISEGICVESTSTASLTEKCLIASRDRLPQIIARMQADPTIYDRMMGIINTYCNSQPSHANRNGCSDLNKRLNEIRFAVTSTKPVCKVVASADNATCGAPANKSILVKCNKGGEIYQGHLKAADITTDFAALAVGATLTGSPDLYRGACGDGAKINDFNQCTSIVQSQGSPSSNVNLSLKQTGVDASGTCQGDTCVVNSNCLGTPVSGGTDSSGDIYSVTMVCACNQLPTGEAANDASIIQACGVDHSLSVLSSGQGIINTGDEFRNDSVPR